VSEARRPWFGRRPAGSLFLFALVLAASAGGILVLGSSAARGTTFERYSTYRAEPDGASACAETLKALGFKVTRETEDLRGLPHDGSLLVLVGPFPDGDPGVAPKGGKPPPFLSAPMPEGEVDGILAWVRAGGRLLVLEGHENLLYQALGLEVDGSPTPTEQVSFAAEPSTYGVFTATGARLSLASGASFVPPTDGAWTVLWKKKSGEPVALARTLDEGEVVVLSDPQVATNEGLARAGNLDAIYSVAAASPRDVRTVRFDELRHGFASSRNVMGYLRRHGLDLAVVQGGIAFVLAAWAASRARRRPRGRSVSSRIESREFVSAMANIYSRARVSDHAARSILRRCERAMTIALGERPAGLPDERVAQLLRERGVRNFHGWPTVRDEAVALGLGSEIVEPKSAPAAPTDAAVTPTPEAPPARVPAIAERRLVTFARLAGALEREVRAAARINVDELL
jgi:hypothetical protein